ncbi:hypothetical protein [Brachyspira pilosicoli]
MCFFKKVFLILFFVFSLSFNVFAQKNRFEVLLNVPFGMSIGFSDSKLINNPTVLGMKSFVDFEIGASLQFGYMYLISERMALSILAEFGYSHDSYSYRSEDLKTTYSYYFENILVGVLPKFIIDNFSIGFGIGVKMPTIVNYIEKVNNKNIYNTSLYYSEAAPVTFIKLTFDYSFPINKYLNINLGSYVLYDVFVRVNNPHYQYHNISALSVGMQLALRFVI